MNKKSIKTVLLIEDNPGDVLILKEQLRHAGWPVARSEHRGGLYDALERLKLIKPSIVFLDLNLQPIATVAINLEALQANLVMEEQCTLER